MVICIPLCSRFFVKETDRQTNIENYVLDKEYICICYSFLYNFLNFKNHISSTLSSSKTLLNAPDLAHSARKRTNLFK